MVEVRVRTAGAGESSEVELEDCGAVGLFEGPWFLVLGCVSRLCKREPVDSLGQSTFLDRLERKLSKVRHLHSHRSRGCLLHALTSAAGDDVGHGFVVGVKGEMVAYDIVGERGVYVCD